MAEGSAARRWLSGLAAAGLSLLVSLSAACAAGSELTASEKRGREIYSSGVSPSGEPIRAHLGKASLELPGEAATCGSCHGYDGAGRPESGVLPSNITWNRLTRSYGHAHTNGLVHRSFDEQSFGHYLRTGIYPGGLRGDRSMPFYAISDRDLGDLVAYLKRVGEVMDPGLSDSTIKIGTVLPSEGRLGQIGAVIRDVLEAYFREVNAAGGVHRRQLELVVRETAADGGITPQALKTWLAAEQPFALLSPFTPRVDLEVQSTISSESIPLIGPFTLYSIRRFALNRNVFYLYPGLGEQVTALVRFAAEQLELSDPQLAVLHPDEGPLDDVVAALGEAASKRSWPPLRSMPFPVGAFDAIASVRELRAAGVDVVISLGVESELRSLLEAASEQGWSPYVLAAGTLSGGAIFDAPQAFEKRVYLAYPTLPQDRKEWALDNVSKLLEGNERARAHIQAVISAYSSASVLVEAMRRAGRDLGRRRLISELESFYQFDTGLTPPITYTANRRIGAKGAYVFGSDSLVEGRLPESIPWVDLD